MTILQTIILAIVQGVTELFPISSAGHSVLAPYIFRWNLDPTFLKEKFLPFVVMMHLGTSVALIIFFKEDWKDIVISIFDKKKGSRKLLKLVIVGSIPVAILGGLFEKKLSVAFGSPISTAAVLILNGFLLFFGEKYSTKGRRGIERLNYRQAIVIGTFQSLGLIPGFSRSGASMTAGFLMRLKHEDSARFSMLLAVPAILGATILEVPKLFKAQNHAILMTSAFGGVVAGICAIISVSALMKWFNKKEVNAMRPFSYYCWVMGTIVIISHFI